MQARINKHLEIPLEKLDYVYLKVKDLEEEIAHFEFGEDNIITPFQFNMNHN